MKGVVAFIFGLGLIANALLFVPQVVAIIRSRTAQGVSVVTFGGFNVMQAIGVLHGLLQRDWSLTIGMAASLLTSGSVTALALFYREASARKGADPI